MSARVGADRARLYLQPGRSGDAPGPAAGFRHGRLQRDRQVPAGRWARMMRINCRWKALIFVGAGIGLGPVLTGGQRQQLLWAKMPCSSVRRSVDAGISGRCAADGTTHVSGVSDATCGDSWLLPAVFSDVAGRDANLQI